MGLFCTYPLRRDPYVESLTKHSSILINLPSNNKPSIIEKEKRHYLINQKHVIKISFLSYQLL